MRAAPAAVHMRFPIPRFDLQPLLPFYNLPLFLQVAEQQPLFDLQDIAHYYRQDEQHED